MAYYVAKTLNEITFEEAIERVTSALKEQGFGVLSDIDVQATLKNKINVDFRPYRILGACNPTFAHKALTAEDKIGTMLPCSVVVQQKDTGEIEVAAIDPVASMQAVDNDNLQGIAHEVQQRLKSVVENL